MNAGKFSRAFALLKDLLAADPTHHEGRRLLATLLLKFGNLVTAKNAFDSLLKEAFQHQDYTLSESLLREYLAVGPRCIPFIEMLGEVYERKGDPIAAVIERHEGALKTWQAARRAGVAANKPAFPARLAHYAGAVRREQARARRRVRY